MIVYLINTFRLIIYYENFSMCGLQTLIFASAAFSLFHRPFNAAKFEYKTNLEYKPSWQAQILQTFTKKTYIKIYYI